MSKDCLFGRVTVEDTGSHIAVVLAQGGRPVQAMAVSPHEAIRVATDLLTAARRWFGQPLPEALPK